MATGKETRHLRADYALHLELGYLLALILLIFVSRLDLSGGPSFEVTLKKQEAIEIADLRSAKQPKVPPPPPRASFPREGSDKDGSTQTERNYEASLKRDGTSGGDGPPPQPRGQRDSATHARDVYLFVEKDPECGGIDSVQSQVTYPPAAQWAGIEGKVFVQFIVNEQGDVTHPKITRSEHSLLNDAALNAVRKLKCTPGEQRGRPVRVQMSLPVSFKLDDESQ